MHFAGGHFIFIFNVAQVLQRHTIMRKQDIDQVVRCKGCFNRISYTQHISVISHSARQSHSMNL